MQQDRHEEETASTGENPKKQKAGSGSGNPFVCGHCHNSFESIQGLGRHVKTHEGTTLNTQPKIMNTLRARRRAGDQKI